MDTDYEADSLGGRLEALRLEMNGLIPDWGDTRVGEVKRDLAQKRDEVLSRFMRS